MKYLVSIMVALFIVSGFSMSYAKDCPQGQEKKGWKCVDIETPDGGSSSNATIGDIRNTNTNFNTAFGGEGGKGGSVGDVRTGDNKNYNTNLNNNTNKNDNTNIQGQGQLQGQAQVQGQLQGQSQTGIVKNDITIEDNRVVNQKIVDFNHITPDIGRTSAEHKSVRDTMRVKAVSDIDGMLSSITLTSARKLGEDTKDYKMFKELLFENDFRTSMLTKGAKGEFMGSIILTPTGSKVTLGGMSGRAYEAAMDAGATHWELHNFSGQYTEGSKAGLDFGSAASVVAKANGSAVIAPGATLGYSTAWSNNEYRPGVVIDLYFDRTMKITPVAKTQPYISR